MIINRLAGTDLRRRTTTALIGVPVILIMIYAGSPFWDSLVVIMSLACAIELQHMISPGSRTGLLGMFAIMLACFVSTPIGNYLPLLAILGIFLAVQVGRSLTLDEPKRQMLLRHFLYASLGALYIGMSLSLLLAVRPMNRGLEWTMIAFASNWATDTLALLGGRVFGKHKLAPHISPGKTVEGASIGIASGLLIGLALCIAVGMPFAVALAASVAIPPLTVIGDLLESWTKRFFAVKDAGTILPGHGGILDRADGMLLAAPALYLILRFLH